MKFLFKNFFFIIIFFFLNSHTNHYKDIQKIEMEIFKDDKLIGYNYYFFKRTDKTTIITNQVNFTVKLLGATIFKVEGYGEEIYEEDQLVSFRSKTLQNKKVKFVNLELDKINNKFIVNGSSFTGIAGTNNIVGNWWNHKLLEADTQISPVSGSVKKQLVTFLGRKKIELYGKTYDTELFSLKSIDKNLSKNKKLNFDIWFDKKSGMIMKVKYSRMGNWEYRLKKFK